MKNFELFMLLTGATTLNTTPALGELCVANASQNYAASLAQDITSYLAGPTSPDEEALLDLLFPPVQTADFFQFPVAGDGAFLTEADDSDIRGLGSSFKRIEHTGTTATDATQQKGLTKRVDHRTLPRVNGAIVAGWENREAASLKKRLIRADLIRGLSVLSGAAHADTKTWSASTNPDGDLRAMVELSRVASGMAPTHLLIGHAAQQLRQDAYEAATRANHAMANHADYTMQQLASYAGAGQAILQNSITQTKKGAAKASMLGLICYAYAAEKGQSIDDPSNVKRAWSPTLGGGQWVVFIQESAAWTDITVFQQSKIFSPMTAGVEKITVS
jgi:hypothetical protein